MRASPGTAALGALALAVAACAQTQPLPEVQGGVEVGLRRGASWSTLKVRPPYIIGPRGNLHIENDTASGFIGGRAVRLHLDRDGIEGTGPAGAVAVDIVEAPDKLVIEGTWNGNRVHFDITPEALRGSLAVEGGGGGGGGGGGRGRRGGGGGYGGSSYCQYVLDRLDRDGSRLGTSICSGLPEETRLEIPAPVLGWLNRQELVLLLLALLSAPPHTTLERTGGG